MPWYTLDEALNSPGIPKDWENEVIVGDKEVSKSILKSCAALAKKRKRPCLVALDGNLGVNWKKLVSDLKGQSKILGVKAGYVDVSTCYRSPAELARMLKRYLENDPCFGYVYKGKLSDFFSPKKTTALCNELKKSKSKSHPEVLICYGSGATIPSLAPMYDFIGYLDVTRKTMVARIEKKQVLPLGSVRGSLSARKPMKRLSYVDNIVLNKHKKGVLTKMDWYIDASSDKGLKLVPRGVYDGLLEAVSKYPFRLKPIYLSGVWGGQYLKKLRKLPSEMINCAFCFEVIPQEQSLRIAIGNKEIDVPSCNLFFSQPIDVMGQKSFKKFGYYFPITANYDDTYQGGNLAIQVHPNGNYLKKNFNERTCRDESYYVVKAWKGARTYHGLKDNTDLKELRRLSVRAEKKNIAFDHDKYVNSWPSKQGDLFLIPAGTVHASGANQLVLELDLDPSWGPQEYTFHIYDYLRKNLDGTLRDIHIDHSFSVIRSYRRTSWIPNHLKHKPKLIRKGRGWAEYSLGDYKTLHHKTNRLEFTKKIDCDTKGRFNVLVLVDGQSVLVRSVKHPERKYAIKFTEMVIVPACFGKYVIVNTGKTPCKVTKSFIK